MSSYTNLTTSYFNSLPPVQRGSFETRALCAANVLVTPITCAIDTIAGVGTGIGALVTGGCISSLNDFAVCQFDSSQGLLVYPWMFAIAAINPDSKINEKPKSIFSDGVCGQIIEFAQNCNKSDDPVKKHFVTRLSMALFGLTTLVTKLAEAIIGLPFVLLATLTLGKFETLNRFAVLTLSFPCVIQILFISALGTLNPGIFDQK